jgi:hypothetical protein
VLLGAILDHGIATAAQLTLTWTDNSGGTGSTAIDRKTGTTGTYAQIATRSPGIVSYADTTVVAGTTYCYRVRAFNSAGFSPYSNEACGASSGSLSISVSKAGTGTGTVTSSPAGIACGTDCSQTYASGSVVTLTATAASGSTFGGWSGGGCSGTGSCTITGNTQVSVTANFTAPPSMLTVAKAGTGSGTVTSSPAGINCGTDCSQTYTSGTAVTLTATPATGSLFSGWSGASDCSNGSVTVTANLSCTATFTPASTSTITIDNGHAGTRYEGLWKVSIGKYPYGANSLYSAGTGADRYYWTPTIQIAGDYYVYVRWTARPTRSKLADLSVVHATGVYRTTRNQQIGGAVWQPLGAFRFNTGTAGFVRVTDANGQVCADAVRFVLKAPAP